MTAIVYYTIELTNGYSYCCSKSFSKYKVNEHYDSISNDLETLDVPKLLVLLLEEKHHYNTDKQRIFRGSSVTSVFALSFSQM